MKKFTEVIYRSLENRELCVHRPCTTFTLIIAIEAQTFIKSLLNKARMCDLIISRSSLFWVKNKVKCVIKEISIQNTFHPIMESLIIYIHIEIKSISYRVQYDVYSQMMLCKLFLHSMLSMS